jgi:hypothetical protein
VQKTGTVGTPKVLLGGLGIGIEETSMRLAALRKN